MQLAPVSDCDVAACVFVVDVSSTFKACFRRWITSPGLNPPSSARAAACVWDFTRGI